MAKQIFNMDTLVSVEIHDKQECGYFSYQPYKKHWLWGTQIEGFWLAGMNSLWEPDYLRAGKFENIKFIVEDNKVYYLPYVTLKFVGLATKIQEFDTYEEAKRWGEAQVNTYIKQHVRLYFS